MKVYTGVLYYFLGAITGSVVTIWLPPVVGFLVVLIGVPVSQLIVGILKLLIPQIIDRPIR